MGSSSNSADRSAPEDAQVSAEFRAAFGARAGTAGWLRFDAFVTLALYDPEVGYYRRARPRVGTGAGTDFITATTAGPVFGEAIVAACTDLLGGRPSGEFTFVELGAETAKGILAEVSHPFAGARTVGIGERFNLQGPCVVFANELLDAQPFRRWRYHGRAWRELGVRLVGERLEEIDCGPAAHPDLPLAAPEGYTIDAPLAAAALAADIARAPWTGLFVTCDYGKSWAELCHELPEGTARAYRQHRQSAHLLANPGSQDLTCHVCWDWVTAAFAQQGFVPAPVASQESFLVRHAGSLLARIAATEAGRFSARKQALTQLLHPAHLGQKFQVFSAQRGL